MLNLINISFLKQSLKEDRTIQTRSFELRKSLIEPLINGWRLLKSNPAFFHYLFLFFLGGAGIIATQPLLPKYFNDILGLSYMQLTLAFSFCKGIAFIASSPFWAKFAVRFSLFRLNALTNLLTCLYFGSLLAATSDIAWLYAGYLCYGVMQGGSELSWNLSGPVFSKNEDSIPYSSLNLILVGIRGCIFPFLGLFVFTHLGAITVFIAAFCFCAAGIAYGLWLDGKFQSKQTYAST